ncbi:DUF1513 domain-containing protein [Phaeovulum vinaykumarii]|uniref:Twin-arginine translocation pathway signal n=1 Tax=Phaeovulum vinaykumarii TaxID=407234 RepID=A0A1N7L0N2_9RHOB|nr:DUF1513 domain-containing protein [Phaeovulum vinaykumarii]SIS67398.1 hypothetical protein SAMN05421795_102396 [Phaeovulum vinaykumarii]SOC00730.1 hypothetical protein SAMN05878426_102376 [Phaeovulum vinaykumarii]
MTTRRGFLASLLAASSLPTLGWAAAGAPAWIAAARAPGGDFALFGLDAGGAETFRVALPARGHAGAGHPTRAEAVAFARRPGTFALVVDCARGAVRHRLSPPEGVHFNGHGVFIHDGAVLATVEQQADDSRGQIGFWDVAAGYRRMGAAPTGGIGPHDLRLMPDGRTLVVANGGIATDPSDRRKLNLDTMRPNLGYLDLEGAPLEQVALAPDLWKNSIRHLAVRGDGLVGFAMQWQGALSDPVPLLGLHRRGAAPVLAAAPGAQGLAMRGYAGSIAFAGDGAEVAITSPRGGRVQRFTPEGAFLGEMARADVCGLAAHPDGLLASDGLGALIVLSAGRPRLAARHDLAWDNHIVTLPRTA